MDRNIIEEMLINAEEQLKYKNRSYCKGQIFMCKRMLEMYDKDIEEIKKESKRY